MPDKKEAPTGLFAGNTEDNSVRGYIERSICNPK
jgi:hypothetical protein